MLMNKKLSDLDYEKKDLRISPQLYGSWKKACFSINILIHDDASLRVTRILEASYINHNHAIISNL